MAGSDVFDFEAIMQRDDNLLNVSIRRNHKMKAARRFEDFVDPGMRTANYNHQSLGGVEDQGEFAQFKCAQLVGDEGD